MSSLPPLECKYVTDECLREWKAGGNPSFRVPNPVPPMRFLYELCWTMVRGELPFQKCKVALDSVEFVDKLSAGALGSTLADVVTQMAQDLTMPGEYRARLIKLAKWLVESAIVPMRFFQERCEEEFLWDAEMIKIKAQDLKSKEVRVNTRLLYQQTKFNLLREESEGYAKLITLLCRGSQDTSESATTAIISVIKSLIGHFDLDPNRVFDIVLDCFELQPDNKVFLELIPLFPKSHASQILGFKFQYYQRMEVASSVPFGLYKLTALLVKEEFIDLDGIYSHLLPKDEEAFEHYSTFSSKRLDEANKIGKINLAATGKDLMEDEKQGDVTIDLYAASDMEADAVAERSAELENSQTLGLLSGFLSVDDWYNAHLLFERLSPLNPVAHVEICKGLFRLIENLISPIYHTVREVHRQSYESPAAESDAMDTSSSGCRSSIKLPREVFQMIATVGPYLYRDTLLLQKVCRVLRAYLSASDIAASDEQAIPNPGFSGTHNPRARLREARARVEEALGCCLLPSLQLIPANPAVGQEIWEVLSLLPYEVRYRLYGEWEKDDERNPVLLAARQTAKLDTRRILKRLAKENLKQLGRMVAKLAHACPMTVLRTIIHQIEAYRDMIAPVVDAFKYLTQLEYDILEYVVIERLAQSGRDKLKDDGLNLSDWLQSLASFWGHLCKKYPSMELRGLFQYLVNQLKKGQGIELLLLQELIQQMANVQYTENLTEEQLDAMAGSETLRYQATSFGATRNNKALVKSTNRLRDSLLPKDDPKLAIPLLLLLAQHRSVVLINSDAPYIKMVSEQFDRCHGTLLQYVEFLCNAIAPASAYAELIPSLDDLIHLYHLDPEVAFLIYRPVMRLFRCAGGSDTFWPLDNSEAASSSPVNVESGDAENFGELVLDLGPSGKPVRWSELLVTVRRLLPSKAWNSLSPDLYATFWGLTLYDLYVPRNRYEAEIRKQHAALKALEELSDYSSSAITKRKKDKERIQESLDRLTAELKMHEDNVASVRRRLSHEKEKWLSSCPDTLKINMEFLQRCIFPRCTFSMPDAVYCAMFVHTLHSLGTPFFNTVNHIDVLICKTLHPMICCCTEYEAGRLGRFLFETLKIAYHWKSDESIYERECGNMPGFAVYYRFPNSQRVTYGQFIKVHWKWSQRISRLLIQCLESLEYMEIRNALILLNKISGVFPVTKRSGINIEKRVTRIKSDEREDLKVLATSVAAALASRKPAWVTDEEFGMGYLDLKPQSGAARSAALNIPVHDNSVSPSEPAGGRGTVSSTHHGDFGNSGREQVSRTKSVDGRSERIEGVSHVKSVQGHHKSKGGNPVTISDVSSTENKKQADESANRSLDVATSELKSSRRTLPAGAANRALKQDLAKEDNRPGKAVGRTSGSSRNDNLSEGRQTGGSGASSMPAPNGISPSISTKVSNQAARTSEMGSESKVDNGSLKSVLREDHAEVSDLHKHSSRLLHSPRHDNSVAALKGADKLQKRSSPAEEPDRLSKRRKGDNETRDVESERFSDKEKSIDARPADFDKTGIDEQIVHRSTDKPVDKSKDKGNERHDKDHKERSERPDKPRLDDNLSERPRDRSMERYARERSVEKGQERGAERSYDRALEKAKDERVKEDRSKLRHSDVGAEKSHSDDRFHGQSLPPPPPLPPNLFPESFSSTGRKEEEDGDKRVGGTKPAQMLSPKHDEREHRRSEENMLVSQDDTKRRREEDFRERKRDERDGLSIKLDDRERERDREKAVVSKEEADATAASKRRKLKRDHMPSVEAGEFSPVGPAASLAHGLSQPYDGRDRGDKKGVITPRAGGYVEEPSMRIHTKELPAKVPRRDAEPVYEREWDDEKRQRAEQKRRHRK